MMKRYYIKSSASSLKKEIDVLREKIQSLETQKKETTAQQKPRRKRTAIYSPPEEVEARVVEMETEDIFADIK